MRVNLARQKLLEGGVISGPSLCYPAPEIAEEAAQYGFDFVWIDWQHDIEVWRGSVESRLEGLEELTNLIPEILERLGPPTLTPDHQRAVQKYVQQVHELSGKPYGTVYESLKAAFGVARYVDIPDQDWSRVVQWFKVQVEQWRKT